MSSAFSVPLVVRGYECGPQRTVGIPTICSFFEHTRWDWILEPELGLVEGLHSGHFFVVVRQTVALARTFGIGTELTVRAALRKSGRVQCEVEHDVVRNDGVLLAKAWLHAVWIGPNGRMKRLPEATRGAVTDAPMPSIVAPPSSGIATSFLSPPEQVFEPTLERLVQREVPSNTRQTKLTARPSDCDMFEHVNASNYIRYFENVLGRPSVGLDIEYRGQALSGDALTIHSWEHSEGRTGFALTRGDDVLCRAVLR